MCGTEKVKNTNCRHEKNSTLHDHFTLPCNMARHLGKSKGKMIYTGVSNCGRAPSSPINFGYAKIATFASEDLSNAQFKLCGEVARISLERSTGLTI